MNTTTIGILGGGQLGRMLALAGYPLGLRFRIYDPSPEAPAEHVAEFVQGDYDDLDKLSRFADGLDVITYEFENVPVHAVEHLAKQVTVHPSPAALAVAQDRVAEKEMFPFRHGEVISPQYATVDALSELDAGIEKVGLPAVLKTRRGGYDGKGQYVLRTATDVRQVARETPELEGQPLILESLVPFTRELSLISVRDSRGVVTFYPLIENRHGEGILRESRAPAINVTDRMQLNAQEFAAAIMRRFDYVGVLAIEFFDVNGQLLANEIAPRVHNSGHWTIEGAVTSQFENHVRAIAGMPLGSTEAMGSSVMFNLIGEVPNLTRLLEIRGAHVHLYGKSPRPWRKLGHVTAWTANVRELELRTSALRKLIDGELGKSD